jgi:long-chain acyl-CoA synthetase
VSALPTTTAGYLRHWAAEKPDHPALRWTGGELTYQQLHERACRVARALEGSGVGPGDRVAFLDKNSPEQVEMFFGAAYLGAVPAPVNYRLAPPEIAVIVSDAEAKVFAVGAEFTTAVEKVADELAGATLLCIGEGTGSWVEFGDWRDAAEASDPSVQLASEDVAYQLYSSGTTGRPKGVQLTHANLETGLTLYPRFMGMHGDSVSMVAMPLYHIGGGGWALAGFRVGATNVLVREVMPAELVDLVEREGITHAFLVPAVLQFMLSVPGVDARDFSSLRYILYGASPISETVLTGAMRTFKCGFVQAYGLTESTGTVILLPEGDHDPEGPNRHRLRSAGVPTPDAEIRIVDPGTGRDVPTGEVGEIWIKGPTVMKGYWKMPEETAATIQPDGWLRSGDAGYRDADGYVYIHDRVKDMIVSGGENVYPAEVENAVMSHPDVADVAVIGIPHEKWGETGAAMVVRVAGSTLTEEVLLAYCRERLAGFKCPTQVVWLDELPRNPSGKVLKKDLRAPYWEGHTRLVG